MIFFEKKSVKKALFVGTIRFSSISAYFRRMKCLPVLATIPLSHSLIFHLLTRLFYIRMRVYRCTRGAPVVFCWMHIAPRSFRTFTVYIKVLFLGTATARFTASWSNKLRRDFAFLPKFLTLPRVIRVFLQIPSGQINNSKLVTFHLSDNFKSSCFPS